MQPKHIVYSEKLTLNMLERLEYVSGGDFDTEDKERSDRPKKFEDEELEHSIKMHVKLKKNLEKHWKSCLKAAGYIHKQGNWVPYELKPLRDVKRR